jgi:hypothetical protein
MIRIRTNQARHGARRAKAFAALALAVLLGAGGTYVLAGDDAGMLDSGGGGDTVGSLPLMSSQPPGSGGTTIGIGIGPERPIATLTGPRDEVLAAILLAEPTGADGEARLFHLVNGEIRIEFYGRIRLLLDRQLLHDSPVHAGISVGSTFAGGLASYRVGGQLRAVEPLSIGPIDLRLRDLDDAGVLDQGLNWHAISLAQTHRVIDIEADGNLIELSQRD